MRKPLNVREAAPTDAKQISELICTVTRQFNASSSGKVATWFLESVSPSSITACMENRQYHCLVGYCEQSLTGVVTIRDMSHIHHLFVDPAFHRQGIAAALWAHAKTHAIASGNTESFSVRSSEYALPIYQRFGFRVTSSLSEKNGLSYIPMKLELA